MKVPYFPFSPVFDLKMGTAPLHADHSLVEVDDAYMNEIALKRSLLAADHRYYYQARPDSIAAQWDVLGKILQALSTNYPTMFSLEVDQHRWRWKNVSLGESIDFEWLNNASLPHEPLDWVGRQVQEDLLLLDPKSIVVAGQLCFPSGWCMDEKFDQHFLKVHEPLPSVMSPMIQAADKLIERIPAAKPIGRTNWGFRVSNQLDLSSRHRDSYLQLLREVSAGIDDENAGDKIYFRIERQTLSRLPSGYVLFTIHTYNSLLKEEAEDSQRRQSMLSFLKTVPEELLTYKLMTSYIKPLIGYLASSSAKAN